MELALAQQVLINDIMCLMKGIALHNTLLIHQHSSCRMDGGPHSAPDQKPPPPGFYQTILVQPLPPNRSI